MLTHLGSNGTSGRKRGNGRNRAFDRRQRQSSVGRQRWDRSQQSLRVGMRRSREDRGLGREFNQAPRIHHRDAIGDMRDNREIMGDEEHGERRICGEDR